MIKLKGKLKLVDADTLKDGSLINTREFINGVNNSRRDYYEKTVRFFGGGGVIITLTSLTKLYVTDIDTNETVLFTTLKTSPADKYNWGWDLRDALLDLEMILGRSSWKKELKFTDSVTRQEVIEAAKAKGLTFTAKALKDLDWNVIAYINERKITAKQWIEEIISGNTEDVSELFEKNGNYRRYFKDADTLRDEMPLIKTIGDYTIYKNDDDFLKFAVFYKDEIIAETTTVAVAKREIKLHQNDYAKDSLRDEDSFTEDDNNEREGNTGEVLYQFELNYIDEVVNNVYYDEPGDISRESVVLDLLKDAKRVGLEIIKDDLLNNEVRAVGTKEQFREFERINRDVITMKTPNDIYWIDEFEEEAWELDARDLEIITFIDIDKEIRNLERR